MTEHTPTREQVLDWLSNERQWGDVHRQPYYKWIAAELRAPQVVSVDDVGLAEIAIKIARRVTSPNFTYENPFYLGQAKDMIYTALKDAAEGKHHD